MRQRWLYLLWLGCCPLIFLWGTAKLLAQSAEPTPITEPSAPPIISHTIGAGDSLYSLSLEYGVSLEQLLQNNGLTDQSVLQLGQAVIISGVAPLPSSAQLLDNPTLRDDPTLPAIPKMHTVQGGETLSQIAKQYGLSADDLLVANQLSLSQTLQIGQPLFIPQQTGDIYRVNYTVELGDTLAGIAQKFNNRPNSIWHAAPVNPYQLTVGQQLAVVSRSGSVAPIPLQGLAHLVSADETLITIATAYNVSPIALARANGLPYPAELFTGQQLRVPNSKPYRPLPQGLRDLRLTPSRLVQGEAFMLYLELSGTNPVTPTGTLQWRTGISTTEPFYYQNYSQTFSFSPYREGFVALVGLDAFISDGVYQLELKSADTPLLTQWVEVEAGQYGTQQITVSAEIAPLLAPEIRAQEDAILLPYYLKSAETPLWDSSKPFQAPLAASFLTARYGAARSYNGGPYSLYHSGVDYGAPLDTPVQAVAAGTVVFSDVTRIRGNLVIVDHGLGVMTAYYHMNSRLVKVGEGVTAGQAVGSLGNTGLSTAAHLHWDVRLHGVPVNGLTWLETAFLP